LQGVGIPQQDLQEAGDHAAVASADGVEQHNAGDLEQLQQQQVSTKCGFQCKTEWLDWA
jgi:hypothetical protein